MTNCVEEQPSPPHRVRAGGVEIRVRHVEKHFGSHKVLTDVNLEIAPGEFVAIVGRSGCGKSTLLRLIAGLDLATQGQIEAGGKLVTRQLADTRILFQDTRLLPWRRVLDNVGIGRSGDWKPAAMEALEQVGLTARANDWPAVLSGGQRQRVALARAIVSHPKLMLLDEPLGALDALTRLDMQRLVEEVWRRQGFTAILVTHDVSEAVTLADRVVILERGHVPMILQIEHSRPRLRGDASLSEIEGEILARILERT